MKFGENQTMEQKLSHRVSESRRRSPKPEILSEIVELVNNPSTSIARLAATVEKDQTLTNMVLRKANSLYYGFPGRVTNINFALVLLGFNALRETLTQTLVSTAFRDFVGVLSSYEDLWNHSLATGMLSRALAEKTGRCNAEEALIAGLLHDIGFLRLQQQGATEAVREGQRVQHPRNSFERTQNARNHGELGSELARLWKLPQSVEEAIRYHHQPTHAVHFPDITATVHLAEVLATRLSWRLSEEEPMVILQPESLKRLGLDERILSGGALEDLFAYVTREFHVVPRFEEVVKRFRSVVIEAIELMDPTMKVVLALQYAEGMSWTEIGRFLHRSEEEIQSLHENAMAFLHRAIQQLLTEGTPC